MESGWRSNALLKIRSWRWRSQPTTSSLPKWVSIANKDDNVFVGPFLAIDRVSSWIFKRGSIVFTTVFKSIVVRPMRGESDGRKHSPLSGYVKFDFLPVKFLAAGASNK
jgi:hypothetical protein